MLIDKKGLAGKRIHGGTTVSGTMILAHLAGIKVFGTGGLGMFTLTEAMTPANTSRRRSSRSRSVNGYIRYENQNQITESNTNWEIADLTELGRTPVAVVSSGCKSFLDIPKTLEYLETEGVLVGTFADGRKGHVDYPAFWTRDSGIPSPKVIQNEHDAAAMICKLCYQKGNKHD